MPLQSQIANRKSQILAWQGWSIVVPVTWNPVKVDGDADEGSLLLADLHAARLGLRWKRAAKRGDPAAWAERSLADEVGKLAAGEAMDYVMTDADEWQASRLYTDRDPPGRDVWVGHSRRSGRVLQVVHHAASRTKTFADTLLPTLTDTPADTPRQWSIFDLSLVTRPGLIVQWYRFNAGDLAVGLADERRNVTVVRQIGPAELALARQPLRAWLTQMPTATKRLYRPVTDATPTTLVLAGRSIDGLRGTLVRKRRLWWAWFVAPRQAVLALHDEARDRLVLGQGRDEDDLREILATVGSGSLSRVLTGKG